MPVRTPDLARPPTRRRRCRSGTHRAPLSRRGPELRERSDANAARGRSCRARAGRLVGRAGPVRGGGRSRNRDRRTRRRPRRARTGAASARARARRSVDARISARPRTRASTPARDRAGQRWRSSATAVAPLLSISRTPRRAALLRDALHGLHGPDDDDVDLLVAVLGGSPTRSRSAMSSRNAASVRRRAATPPTASRSRGTRAAAPTGHGGTATRGAPRTRRRPARARRSRRCGQRESAHPDVPSGARVVLRAGRRLRRGTRRIRCAGAPRLRAARRLELVAGDCRARRHGRDNRRSRRRSSLGVPPRAVPRPARRPQLLRRRWRLLGAGRITSAESKP